jgi:hypothetical protein
MWVDDSVEVYARKMYTSPETQDGYFTTCRGAIYYRHIAEELAI